MKRTFEATNGRKIWVQLLGSDAQFNSQYLVELMAPGYVIAFWAARPEGPELQPVQDRVTKEDVDAETMMEALRYGQSLAELAQYSDATSKPLQPNPLEPIRPKPVKSDGYAPPKNPLAPIQPKSTKQENEQ